MIEHVNKVCAIIVTYNPVHTELSLLLKALSTQVQRIIIIDNNSKEKIKNLVTLSDSRLSIIDLPENIGLGAALNIGITQAQQLDYEFAILFDQDSIPSINMVSALLKIANIKIAQGESIASVAPIYKTSNSSILSGFVQLGWFGFRRIPYQKHKITSASFVISSGSLIPISTFKHIGLMDARLFIDHIDTEWCFRAQSKGYKLYGVCDAMMTHTLGDKRTRFWWGRWRNISHHSPFRYYYIFRNSISLQKRRYIPIQWKIADVFRCLRIAVFFGLFSNQRIACLSMMYRGCVDGLKDKLGPLDSTV